MADDNSKPPIFGISLIGAPGSGKSRLAELLTNDDEFAEFMDGYGLAPISRIDNIDKILEDDQGRAVGVYGDHYVSLAYYFTQALFEDRRRVDNNSYVSTSSPITNMAHVVVRVGSLMALPESPSRDGLIQRENMVGNMLQQFLVDGRWQVSFPFYLELPAKILIPGQEAGTFDSAVDEALRDLNVRLSLGIPILAGTDEDRLRDLVTHVKTNYRFEPVEEPVAANQDS